MMPGRTSGISSAGGGDGGGGGIGSLPFLIGDERFLISTRPSAWVATPPKERDVIVLLWALVLILCDFLCDFCIPHLLVLNQILAKKTRIISQAAGTRIISQTAGNMSSSRSAANPGDLDDVKRLPIAKKGKGKKEYPALA
jgi:hypothetical protein